MTSARARAVVVAALVAVVALLVIAFAWGPLSRQGTSGNQSSYALLSAGLAEQAAGRLAAASGDYRKALQADPNNYWAYYDLGTIDQQANRNTDAERNYRSALALNPDLVAALYNLAILRSGVAPREAETLYRHASALEPKNAAVHLNLGFLLLQEGNKTEGHAELDLAVKLDPQLTSRLPIASPATSPSRKP